MSSSKFSGPFMQKSVLSPLKGNAFIKAKMDAEAAGKSSFSVDGKNYPLKMEEESPLTIDPKKKEAYQDSIQKLHKPAYDFSKYEGYELTDTTGAGDCFTAAFAVKMMEGAKWEECLDFGNKVGFLCVSKFGAGPSVPSLADVEKCFGPCK